MLNSCRNGLAQSSVFVDTPGFGGNGHPSSPSVGGGYCLRDGNFGSRTAEYDYEPGLGIRPNKHCLARGFAENDTERRLAGAKVNTTEIQMILSQPDYNSFSDMLQAGPATVIPEWINGDFGQYTAPNDPLFFLHLTQLIGSGGHGSTRWILSGLTNILDISDTISTL